MKKTTEKIETMENRKAENIKALRKDIATYKSLNGKYFTVIDCIELNEKDVCLDENKHKSRRQSLNPFELVNVYSDSLMNKQLFYIRVSDKSFKFVVSPKIASQIAKSDVYKYATHKNDCLYYVSIKDGKKMFKLVFDAMEKLTKQIKETTVSQETKVEKEA